MATQDHTADARPSVRNEPVSESFPFANYQLYPLSRTQQKRLTNSARIAGVAHATGTIEALLEYSEAYKRARIGRTRDPISPWPLIPSEASGLHAALYYLRQYAGTLPPEPGG
ncbi:hypothetical protein [Dyella mobilis]|uniref:Uncharacterized protein n=1 Tax=Dyella mobilis TaxID=1849582 RepID=A0ABS2KH15_9GAMM|nr:hypothetical protein [Dyella mobilis]MBM7130213.1 hypothetical protein [Dyella mobilis]GLQ96838.1 hypothetical protein GCM10007863_12580 [Dyella mobilis]